MTINLSEALFLMFPILPIIMSLYMSRMLFLLNHKTFLFFPYLKLKRREQKRAFHGLSGQDTMNTTDNPEDDCEEIGLDPHIGQAVNVAYIGLTYPKIFKNDQVLGYLKSVMSGYSVSIF